MSIADKIKVIVLSELVAGRNFEYRRSETQQLYKL